MYKLQIRASRLGKVYQVHDTVMAGCVHRNVHDTVMEGCVHRNVHDTVMAGCVHRNVHDTVKWRAVYTVMFMIQSNGGLCTSNDIFLVSDM
jgi:hypothetical protein